jgi:hypothetical protein
MSPDKTLSNLTYYGLEDRASFYDRGTGHFLSAKKKFRRVYRLLSNKQQLCHIFKDLSITAENFQQIFPFTHHEILLLLVNVYKKNPFPLT